MNKKIIFLILALISSVSLLLRLYHIDLLPLYADEVGGHYQFLGQLIKTGNPYFGFISYTWLFSLTHLGARFGVALYSSLFVFAIYLLTKAISGKNNVSLLAAGLTAIVPWSFMIGRIGHSFVPVFVLTVILHLYFFLRSSTIKDYLISLFFLGWGLFLYPSMAVIAPFAALLVSVYLFRLLPQRRRLPILAVAALVITVCGMVVNNRFNIFSLSGRALDLAIWRDVNTPWEIDKYRALSWNSTPSIFSFGLPPEQLANKLVYNRAMANISTFTRNYLSFFSPDWLFLKGDPVLRHSTGQVGAFYPFLLPFMLYGALKFFQTEDKKRRLTFLLWILISPIPAAITKDGAGYLLRVVTMLPFLTYFCALGLADSFNLIHKRLKPYYFIFLSLIFIYSAYYFFYGYFHVYPALSARAYEYGFRELSDFQVSHQNKTMLVIWDGYYHNNDFRFWQKTPFDRYESFKIKQIVIGESTFWQTFPNLYFSSPKSAKEVGDFIKQYKPSFVVLPDRYFVKYPVEIENLLDPAEQIKYPDQTTALTIYTVR